MRTKSADKILRLVEIDEQIRFLQSELAKLQRERSRLDKERLRELYEEEQII